MERRIDSVYDALRGDEENDADEVALRAKEARRVLDSPVFRDALEAAERNYIQAWKHARTPFEREAAHAKVSVLDDVAKELRAIIARGDMQVARAARQPK